MTPYQLDSTLQMNVGAGTSAGVDRIALLEARPPRSPLSRYLLIGAVTGAVVGGAAYAREVRNRCVDCWSMPTIEVPVYVGGGALIGYGVGGMIYFVRRASGQGNAR